MATIFFDGKPQPRRKEKLGDEDETTMDLFWV